MVSDDREESDPEWDVEEEVSGRLPMEVEEYPSPRPLNDRSGEEPSTEDTLDEGTFSNPTDPSNRGAVSSNPSPSLDDKGGELSPSEGK